ncbi:MAG: hypothetical protein Q7S50_03030 [bacterium]|nr:hypothetical protein [bacterium]
MLLRKESFFACTQTRKPMVQKTTKPPEDKSCDPVDLGPPHFRVVTPGEASNVLAQPVFDAEQVPPKPVKIDWHSASTK